MAVRFASLGSGSEGNALLVESTDGTTSTRILLDCGFGIRETVRRLERLGCTPASLDAILVTHEHGDHIGSAYAFAAKYSVPVWTSHGTYRATASLRGADRAAVRFCRADDAFSIADLRILPYTVPHDAREPLQFIFDDGARRLGVLTDAGMSTEYLCGHLTGLHAFVLECNHDREMLANSAYPWSLKQRIGETSGTWPMTSRRRSWRASGTTVFIPSWPRIFPSRTTRPSWRRRRSRRRWACPRATCRSRIRKRASAGKPSERGPAAL